MALSTGVRLALPLIALMVTTDLALALLGRFSPQFQLLSAAFPLKIAVAVFFLALLVPLAGPAYEELVRNAIELLRRTLRT
jgi:flagellar biosynthetic protein FliR